MDHLESSETDEVQPGEIEMSSENEAVTSESSPNILLVGSLRLQG